MPAQLLVCAAEPVPAAVTTQKALALFLVDLADAGQDCRDRLRALRELLPPELVIPDSKKPAS